MLVAAENHARLASQRVFAEGRVSAEAGERGTRLSRLYQDGAAKIRLPKRPDRAFEAVLINTAGGLTGGDRLRWSAEIGDDASATLTTQACEKIYRSSHGMAELICVLKAGENARLAWLPQETILFERSAFARRLDVDLADGARALLAEATVFGRHAMGETVEHALFRDRWRIRQNGRLVHAEDFALGPEVSHTLRRSAVGGGKLALATVLLTGGDAESHLDAAREIVDDAGGVSFWQFGASGKLLARLVAADMYTLRQTLLPLLRLLNGEAGLPKVWAI